MNVHSDKAVFALAVIASECIVLLENVCGEEGDEYHRENYVKVVEHFNSALKELGEDWEINFKIG